MVLLLRRTATGLYTLAVVLLVAVLALPFQDRLALLGLRLGYSQAILAVLVVAAMGAAFSLGHRAMASGAAGACACALAAALVLGIDARPSGGRALAGFGLYLGAAGTLAAAALMAFASTFEERRHGHLPEAAAPRTFRAASAPAGSKGAAPGAPAPPGAPGTASASLKMAPGGSAPAPSGPPAHAAPARQGGRPSAARPESLPQRKTG